MAPPPSLPPLRTSARVTPVSRLPTIVSPASPAPDHHHQPHNGDHNIEPEQSPLFLSIDSGVKKMRGLVIDQDGTVEWIAEVEFDELCFGTRNGVIVSDGRITSPSLARVAGLDKLLSLLAAFGEYKDSSADQRSSTKWITRIAAISGAATPNCHFLSSSFDTALANLNRKVDNSGPTRLKLSSYFSADNFAIPTPPTSHDPSTGSYARQLELTLAHLSASPAGGALLPTVDQTAELQRKGGLELARRTGRRAEIASLGVELVKLRSTENHSTPLWPGSADSPTQTNNLDGGVLNHTQHILLETNLIATLLTGRLAPLDVASAAVTGLFNVTSFDWDDHILSVVMGGGRAGVSQLRELIGSVELNGGANLGPVGPHLVEHFGFSRECLVVPFTTDTAASSLAYLLSPEISSSAEPSGVVCLSVDDKDSVTIPASEFVAGLEWTSVPSPVANFGSSAGHNSSNANYLVTIANEGAATGRSLVRDLNADGDWDTFSQLCAIVPHGGSIGLDDKCYSLFSTVGPGRGLAKFSHGARIQEFEDRKLNPRLIVEGQFLSFRLRLSRLAAALAPPPPTPASPTPSSLRFNPFTTAGLPRKLLVAGGGSACPALIVILSAIVGCEVVGMPELVAATDKAEAGGTTSSALGAAKKARWAWARAKRGGTEITFDDFERGIEASGQRERQDGAAEVMGVADSLASMRLASGGVVNGELGGGGRLVSLVRKDEGKEFEYYGSMLGEFERLSVGVSKGLI